jgi:hypothetical protein
VNGFLSAQNLGGRICNSGRRSRGYSYRRQRACCDDLSPHSIGAS